MLANAGQVKALQGRKSDNRDCQRLAEFLQDRRLDSSFVPPPEIRQLRQLMRLRQSLLEQRNEVHNQIRDLLETANIKLSSVVSDLMGVSGQRILNALAQGVDSPEQLSWKARGKLRAKEREIREAMKSNFKEFHRWTLQALLRHYDFLTAQVDLFESQIAEHMLPYQEQVALLSTIPGVNKIVAWSLIAELGLDMSVFPTAAHCASWAGVAPGTHESAGKLMSGATKKGNRYLRRILAQAAWATTRCKQGYLKAFFQRIKSRRGWSKAIVAVAHKILVFAYSILRDKQPYMDLGESYFDQLNPDKALRRIMERIDRLGFSATITRKEQLAT